MGTNTEVHRGISIKLLYKIHRVSLYFVKIPVYYRHDSSFSSSVQLRAAELDALVLAIPKHPLD